VIVKAKGKTAIENALKVVQLVRENYGGIHSSRRIYLQYSNKKNNSNLCEVNSFDQYQLLKYD
jgi:hypothetical protein